MPVTTGGGDFSGNTNPKVAELLSPEEVMGMLSGSLSCVAVSDAAGMSSAEIIEAVSDPIQPKAPSRIPIRDVVLEPVRAILSFPRHSWHNWAAFFSKRVANSRRVTPYK